MRLSRSTSSLPANAVVFLAVAAFLLVAAAMAASPIRTLRGAERTGQFGEAIDGVGDVDQDGFDDVIVGEPMHGEARGRAVVFSGRTGRPIHQLRGAAEGIRFGYSATGLGDVNGDHVPDFAVSSPLEASGRVRVYSGADGERLFMLAGPRADSKFGARVSRAGDVDGDGIEDLAVSAPGIGRVAVFSGSSGRRLARQNGFQGIRGETPGEMRVFSNEGDGDIRLVPRAAGDVDGDGFVDLLVGDTWADGAAGDVTLFSGRDGTTMQKWEGLRDGTSYFGFSLDSIQDLDGDGWREILIGASGTFVGSFYGGEVQVRSGRTGELLRRHVAPPGGHAYMGHAVRAVGDLDGDGVEEYFVGLPYRGPDIAFLRGSAWLYSGRTGEVLAEIDGPSNRKKAGRRPWFGYYLGAVGDVNGDGVTDLAVSAPFEDRARGSVRIYSGRALLRRGASD